MSGHDDELTPADRRLLDRARRAAVRPARSAMIWWVGLALIVLGGLGVLISAILLEDLTSHGEEGAVVAVTATAVLVSAIEVASGAGVLAGAGWSRNAARAVCVLSILAGLVGLLNGGSPATVLGLAVNFVLLVALSGEKVRAWCGG
ncbi:hypothetical protein AB0K00_13980 [Dactylosporangium sp. NPDC049525]|uniref:hypothetical protein n=1 Tax=Dactylosporangium sp. NPDC049525 TaxID=3154730 RepID=UPI00341A61F9